MHNQNERAIYEFHDFQLDIGKGVLLRENQPVTLQWKTFELLCVLVKSNGNLITRDELMNALWADTFVEDNNLSQHIRALRKALGENENGGERFIETVTGRGYRFVAKIKEISKSETSFDDKYHQSAVTPQTSNGHKQDTNGAKEIAPLTLRLENSNGEKQPKLPEIQSTDSAASSRPGSAPKKLSQFVKIAAFAILWAVIGGI